MLWTWLVSTAMSRVYAEIHGAYSMSLAQSYDTTVDRQEVAEVLSAVCGFHGLFVPPGDTRLLAHLRRVATEVPVESAPTGAVLETADGAVAYHLGNGVLEPLGDKLTLVTLTPARYVAAWLIPGVAYLHPAARR